MISGLYFATFLASTAVLIDLLLRHKRIISSVAMLSILVTVNSLGRYLLSVSHTLELACLGNLFVYIGACFCPLLLIRILADYSHCPLPKWLMPLLTVFSCVLLGLVLTIGHTGLYYKSITLMEGNGFHYLLKEYGPAHHLYPLMILVHTLVVLYILIQALRRYREIPFSTVSLFLILSIIIMAAYVLERVMDSQVSYVSLGYFLAVVLLMRRVEQINMYDLPTNIAASIEAMNEIAYLEFDTAYRCIGYNQRARELFPEIDETCQVGRKATPNDTPLFQNVILPMYCRKQAKIGQLSLNDHYYDMFIRDIPYLNKPCVGYMLEIVDRTAEQKWSDAMQSYNAQLEKDVARATAHISHMKDMMVIGMASMVESRDDSTGGHIKRTYQVMRTFSEHLLPYCKDLGITPEFLEMVTRAAPMHDLGKIAISDAVLKKQGRYTPEDYEIMKQHPTEGAKIVRKLLTGVEAEEFVDIAENVAHYHHERWDGKGYPDGLRETEIPLEARLMAFPDVCDALLSKRCYKEAFTYDQVFAMIQENLGTQFDPVLGPYFIQCRPELERMYELWYEEDRDARLLELQPVIHNAEA